MSDPQPPPESSTAAGLDPLPRLVQTLVDQVAEARTAWDRIERQAIPLLERIALALERGAGTALTPSGTEADGTTVAASVRPGVAGEVRAAINAGQWDQAAALVASLTDQPGNEAAASRLANELDRARARASASLTDRIEAARGANDATGALEARDQLAVLLAPDDLRAIDRTLIGWLMKLIQRRLRIIPIGTDLAALVAQVADRFGGTPEGASLRAALPTLRRSAGLCPRCAEPYLGVDDACPKCLAQAGQTPNPTPTLTFVSADDDDLDTVAGPSSPLDLNNVETWQSP